MGKTFGKIRNANIFSKLEFSSGFWQLKLANKSKHQPILITPFGRYYYKRIPFEITSSPEIFQKTVSQLMDILNFKNIHVHADDIRVTGRNVDEHDRTLKQVLQLLSDYGLTLNPQKCEFHKSETKYLGFVISNSGIKIRKLPESERRNASEKILRHS